LNVCCHKSLQAKLSTGNVSFVYFSLKRHRFFT
jgi:hypothetical protein